jgi:hypothetical protein
MRLPDFLNGSLEGFCVAPSRFLLAFDFFAQVDFQFLQRHGSFDAGGEHLPPPVCDGLFEVKNKAPFSGWPEAGEPAARCGLGQAFS